jgi:phage shock protein PspC (stress-responsive transcriptional regulator)
MDTDTMNPQAPHSEHTYRSERPPLRRPFAGRMLAGVAEGMGRYLGIDTTLVRIAFVVLVFLGGAGIPLYLAGLLLIPDEGTDQSIVGSIVGSLHSR